MSKKYKAIVYHRDYGCDTGCCGHYVEIKNENGRTIGGQFEFSHPYDKDYKEFARDLVETYVKKTHPECLDSIDWDTLEYSEVSDN